MATGSELAATRPHLTIFDADAPGDAPGLWPAMTLSQFYHTFARPMHLVARSRSPAYVDDCDRSMSLWADLTGDPPLYDLEHRERGARIVARFASKLITRTWQGRVIRSNTRRKHLANVRRVMRLAGPESNCRDAVEVIRRVPWVTLPTEQVPAPAILTLAEIGLWLAALRRATSPRIPGVSPGDWWQALILFAYNTGLRPGSILAARWSALVDNWLTVPADDVKGRRRELRCWCNQHALAAAGRIRRSDDRLFPWPYGRRWFYRLAARLVDHLARPERFRLKALRVTALTRLMLLSPTVAKLQANHVQPRDVTLKHYTDPAEVRAIMEAFPQPRAVFDPQLRLPGF